MRIVIDLQSFQTSSRVRGIGRYSLALSKAMARQAGKHEVWLVVNACNLGGIEELRTAFDNLIPQIQIRTFEVPCQAEEIHPSNAWRARAAERVREAFLAELCPDIVHVSSLFEGWGDPAITSIASFERAGGTAVTLYDLIPLVRKEVYLPDIHMQNWYYRKLQSLKSADLLLAISNYSCSEATNLLRLLPEQVVNISAAIDDSFHIIDINLDSRRHILDRYALRRPFILYTTGGTDSRKNIDGMIKAYALLPSLLRQRFSLVIVCSMSGSEREKYTRLALQLGVGRDQVAFAGYVPEDDLIALYNLCELFVFPSLHEGFGLPALEAMACGAPVIGSDCTSIPEVIGRADALFDPTIPQAIADKMHEVLMSEKFRRSLREHGLVQARKFSWDNSAKRALEAFEALHAQRQVETRSLVTVPPIIRPRLAYVSPLPPAQSGIADYSAELLPELSLYYEIDVIVDQPEISDVWIAANLPIRNVQWFRSHVVDFDRILYHFGNSPYHSHMFELLEHHPGTVVLHDFYLGHIMDWMERHQGIPQAFVRALYASHGYEAVVKETLQGREVAVGNYPANSPILSKAAGIIVHSQFAIDQATKWYGNDIANIFQAIPFLRASLASDRQAARARLGLSTDEFLVCSFGLLGPTKCNHQLLDAWLASGLATEARCRLVFVGGTHDGDYEKKLIDDISKSSLSERIHVTGFVSSEAYRDYLAAADMAVQLRSNSRRETSAALFDCLAQGIPLIANAHGTMSELPDDILVKLEDAFADRDLIGAMEDLYQNEAARKSFSHHAMSYIKTKHAPSTVGRLYFEAIEKFSQNQSVSRRQRLVRSLARIPFPPSEEQDLIAAATCIYANQPAISQKQLLIDVSELSQRDAKTGIQRVTRSILKELLHNPPQGYRVEPVYATPDQVGYRYARRFTLNFLGCPADWAEDAPLEARPGDIFLGLDLQHHVVVKQMDYLIRLHRMGIQIYFVIYDLLPVLLPDVFPPGTEVIHAGWLRLLARFDGVVCISRAVADEYGGWLPPEVNLPRRPFKIGWFHLGADIDNSAPTNGLPGNAKAILEKLGMCPNFLMVGTIEPRKGYLQTIEAFECLWGQDVQVNLVIVGKEGWKGLPLEARRTIPAIMDKLMHHPELGKRLIWLDGISDEYLEKIYAASTCLIASSKGEGFGLPLIEAAQHKLPIIARDIPVFREVAGAHAFYFSGEAPESLASAIKNWLDLYVRGEAPSSSDIPWLTWAESTQQLINVILGENWYKKWPHDAVVNNLKASVCAASGDTSMNAT